METLLVYCKQLFGSPWDSVPSAVLQMAQHQKLLQWESSSMEILGSSSEAWGGQV
jgi:hypothetical protein